MQVCDIWSKEKEHDDAIVDSIIQTSKRYSHYHEQCQESMQLKPQKKLMAPTKMHRQTGMHGHRPNTKS